MINAPRGTNDILPPVSLKWQYVEKKARDIFSLYNYQEIRTPIFEYTDLFQRGIGEATDIVEKQMYTFEDKSGRSITLRPEGTASVVRSFLENKIYGKAQPTKYYYCGPMFRYERPQAGRYRQFHQIGIEAFGSNDPMLDAEVISLGVTFLDELGISNLETYINSIGCKECREEYIYELKKYLNKYKDELCSDCKNRVKINPLRVLDCKNKECSRIMKDAPIIIDYLCNDCKEHFDKTREALDLLNINYEIDPFLVRGLDYYTNTAFEIKNKALGAQDTIFGGGRYNGLTEEIGKRSIPGIGFAIGIERLLLTIDKQNIELPIDNSLDVYFITIGEKAKKKAYELTQIFRKSGLKTTLDYLDRSVGSQMKAADRMDACYTIILGEDELNKNNATVRDMKSGEEKEISLDNIVKEIQRLVE
ncbi:MAG: histidine--tRNA ligase [Halanaerobiales bacterium]